MTRKPIGMSHLIGVVSQEGLRNSFSMHGFYARLELRVAGIHCAFRRRKGRFRQADYPKNGNFTHYDSINK